jgi:hypothetical protein
MPKIGAPKEDADRPYVTVCVICGCLCSKVVSSFTPWGKPGSYAYLCEEWRHRCETEDREGCKPRRVYTDTPEGQAELAKHSEEARRAAEKIRRVVRHILDDRNPEGGHGVPVEGYDHNVEVPSYAAGAAALKGAADFAALMREAGCFEGTCGDCPGCRAKAAGLFEQDDHE